MTIRSSSPQAALILVFCCLVIQTGACGRKAPPRPPRKPDLPAVQDLQAVVMQTGVQLTWSIPFTAEGVDGFNLYRSGPDTVEEDCPSCPRAYELIRTVNVKAGQIYFQVIDRSIKLEGHFYYRVIPSDAHDQLGPDSNEAEVVVKWRKSQ